MVLTISTWYQQPVQYKCHQVTLFGRHLHLPLRQVCSVIHLDPARVFKHLWQSAQTTGRPSRTNYSRHRIHLSSLKIPINLYLSSFRVHDEHGYNVKDNENGPSDIAIKSEDDNPSSSKITKRPWAVDLTITIKYKLPYLVELVSSLLGWQTGSSHRKETRTYSLVVLYDANQDMLIIQYGQLSRSFTSWVLAMTTGHLRHPRPKCTAVGLLCIK